MNEPRINRTVLMSGVGYFRIQAINSYADAANQPDPAQATKEFAAVKAAIEQAGITVVSVKEPEDCPDGVFTANWALCRGDTAIIASLPPGRDTEEAWAEKYLGQLGKKIVRAPYHFSGQGDFLPCGNMIFAGQGYRTDGRMHQFVADTLGYEVISLQTVPQLGADGKPVTNSITGWPDSFFYDLDLALSVLTPSLIAWCPEAFTSESQDKIRSLPISKIEVSLDEAMNHFACNLVSTGQTVVMGAEAPGLKAAIEAAGLNTITPVIKELSKGGGYIRCVALTLDNQ